MRRDRRLCIILSAIILVAALGAFGVYCAKSISDRKQAHKDGMLVERTIDEGKDSVYKAEGKGQA